MKKKTIIKILLCILIVITMGFMFKLNSNAKPKYKITNQTTPSLTKHTHSMKNKIVLNPSWYTKRILLKMQICEVCKIHMQT